MFKNLMVYRLAPGWGATLAQFEQALAAERFVECSAQQQSAVGWVPPRGVEHGALVESVGGQWLARFVMETKSVPGSVVRRRAQQQLAQIEAQTGRKPGKKESRQILEDTLLLLLPQAFGTQSSVGVWIDPQQRLLVLDAGSQRKADAVITSLVKLNDGLLPSLIQTRTSAQAAMAAWLASTDADALPASLAIERECELKSEAEDQAQVKYARHPLDIEQVRQHVAQGKLPVKLALNWDGRISFVLTEAMQLKRVVFLDGVFDDAEGRRNAADNFDADVAISTSELSKLLADLLEALGGELQPGALPQAADSPPALTARAPALAQSVPASAAARPLAATPPVDSSDATATAAAQALPWETDAQALARRQQQS